MAKSKKILRGSVATVEVVTKHRYDVVFVDCQDEASARKILLSKKGLAHEGIYDVPEAEELKITEVLKVTFTDDRDEHGYSCDPVKAAKEKAEEAAAAGDDRT